jgi:AcrR family transcriptional regulator
MPAVAKTTDAAVVAAARTLVERVGADGLSMQAVASAVGVRAPSLYKRFPDRGALIDAVAEAAVADLHAALAAADRAARTPAEALAAMARAYRAFARRSPKGYGLLFTDRGAHAAPAVDSRAAAVAPVLARLSGLVGEQHALSAARLLTAWLHGFVSMELAGAFRLGGDIDDAFAFGLTVLLDGITHWRSA